MAIGTCTAGMFDRAGTLARDLFSSYSVSRVEEGLRKT
jgi:hypothetical protein